MEQEVWVRRDRQTGDLSELSKEAAQLKLQGFYTDVTEVMAHTTIENPMTIGFCDYWPK